MQAIDKIKAKGVDELWCVSVNDAMTMSAWGRECKAQGKVRMMADGNADFSKSIGVTQDLSARGDRKSTRLNSSHVALSRMPSSA